MVEVRANGDLHRSKKLRWSAGNMEMKLGKVIHNEKLDAFRESKNPKNPHKNKEEKTTKPDLKAVDSAEGVLFVHRIIIPRLSGENHLWSCSPISLLSEYLVCYENSLSSCLLRQVFSFYQLPN